MESPHCYPSKVEIQGIVAKLVPEKKSLVLVDLREKDECDDDTCPIRRLPITWTGAMPERKASVQATGKVEKRNGKLVFVADSVKPVKAETEKK